MDRNLALEFVRVTEAAAIAAASWIGRGDKRAADQAAVDEMRDRFNQIDFRGRVVIGEGTKDEAPQLYEGEKIGTGTGSGTVTDIAVDPLEGTSHTAQGTQNAMSVAVVGERGSLMPMPKGAFYIDKLVVGKEAANVIDMDAPTYVNLKRIAQALGKKTTELTVAILERDRNQHYLQALRKAGVHVLLLDSGELAYGIASCVPGSGVDVTMGICGTPEAILNAAATKILGGAILARFPKQKKVFTADDLAKGNKLTFTATGVIDGPLLQGVGFLGNTIVTQSIVMRAASGTVRYITTHHHAKTKRNS